MANRESRRSSWLSDIDALDVPQLPAEQEIAQLADKLLAFCLPEPEPPEDTGEPEARS